MLVRSVGAFTALFQTAVSTIFIIISPDAHGPFLSAAFGGNSGNEYEMVLSHHNQTSAFQQLKANIDGGKGKSSKAEPALLSRANIYKSMPAPPTFSNEQRRYPTLIQQIARQPHSLGKR